MSKPKNILVSGLVNIETTVSVRQFPISYYPIDYPFFGVNTAVSGVACNIAKALGILGDDVKLLSMVGNDTPAALIRAELQAAGIDTAHILPALRQTPNSAVLYDGEGRRQIYCDLKDIQDTPYPFDAQLLDGVELVAACNTNFNRPLLAMARAAGKTIATDVHVLSQIHDGYNRDFMASADILFLSDESIGDRYRDFLPELARTYGNQITVMGRGSHGAAMYLSTPGQLIELPAIQVGPIVNTVGAGDALFSGFIHYYAEGLSPVEALIRGELFASAKIRSDGASNGFVDGTEVEALYTRFAAGLKQGMRITPQG